MPPHRTALHIVAGATGSGKTSVIRTLLDHQPASERWALLINDFGATSLGGAPSSRARNVSLREIGGCACCTGELVLRTALVSLLRESHPDRVVIEASAAAEPSALLRSFAEPTLASAVEVRTVIATAAASQLLDIRYLNAPVYREQLRTADVVVLTAPPTARNAELAAARAALKELVSPHARVLQSMQELEHGVLDRITPPPSQPSP
jgi:G3E family GTPase